MSADDISNGSAPLIILADDDPSIRLILHHILQRDGYLTLEARNGLEALQLYQNNHVDLVLLDAIMPEQDGFETCRILKEQQPELPVLMITALDDDQSVEHAFRVGADDYISKPVNWSVLRHRIARSLALIPSRNPLDKRIFNNQIGIHYTPRINLANKNIVGIEVHAELPLSILPGRAATEYIINSFGIGYQQQKALYPSANQFSVPLWPLHSTEKSFANTLNNLENKHGVQLNKLQIRIHECFFHNESAQELLPLLKNLPVELCIDAFSFSLRSLEFIHQHDCKSIMIDMAKTRKQLAGKTAWLDNVVTDYKNNGIICQACNICHSEDLQLANIIGCTTGSGKGI